MNIEALITELTGYGLQNGLVNPEDKIYTINRLLEEFQIREYTFVSDPAASAFRPVQEILDDMIAYALENDLMAEDTITNRDLFDTKIMGLLTPPPSTVRSAFRMHYGNSPKEATDYYYDFSKATNYIRTDRIRRDEKWVTDTEYGPIDITINLSKPEKDPRDIAKAGLAKKSGYPSCLLCLENEGYAGHISHPARQNHRVIPITLGGEEYYLQYSPYVYYNEHCIVFNKKHTPMKIDRSTFVKLFDFVKQFPHYTVGSNADLPIVGGSILSHDHFQGGSYVFPMARAEIETFVTFKGYEDVTAGILKWPMSVIRLQSTDCKRLTDLSEKILNNWRGYSDESLMILAETDHTPHNTITPIVRMRNADLFEIDLVLRNNITTPECPMGLYHPHNEYHHIKKENIGLIEVMGLAVLPARLKKEMAELKDAIFSHKDIHSDETLEKHADWVDSWIHRFTEAESEIRPEELAERLDRIVEDEIGHYFAKIIACAGVYKRDEAGKEGFLRFIESV